VTLCCALQSKWGYQTLDIAQEVVANYSAAGLPLECLFVDIEYMGDNFRTMTFSEGEMRRCLGIQSAAAAAAAICHKLTKRSAGQHMRIVLAVLCLNQFEQSLPTASCEMLPLGMTLHTLHVASASNSIGSTYVHRS
jgi:hypothetical protein